MQILAVLAAVIVIAALWSTVRHRDDTWTEGRYHAEQVRACEAQRNHRI